MNVNFSDQKCYTMSMKIKLLLLCKERYNVQSCDIFTSKQAWYCFMNIRKSSSLFVSAKNLKKKKNETICTMIIFFLSFACYTAMLPSRLKQFNDCAQSICIKQNQTHLLFTSSKRRPPFTPPRNPRSSAHPSLPLCIYLQLRGPNQRLITLSLLAPYHLQPQSWG